MAVHDDTQKTSDRIEDFVLRRIVDPGIGNANNQGFTAAEGPLAAHVLLPERPRVKVLRDFWVISENDDPQWVVKVPTLAADGKVADEHAALTRLRVDPGTAIVPQPLCGLGGGFIMSYLRGMDLPDLLKNENWASVEKISLDVARRIALMHRDWAGDDSADAVQAQAAAIAGTEPGLLDFVQPYLAGCRVGRVHGDLGPWNIRIDPERETIGFLDWEDTKPLGLQAIDLLAFVYTLPLVVHPQYTRLGYEWLYDTALIRDEPLIDLIVQMFTAYGEITGQPPGHLARLLPLFCQYMINRISAEGRDPSKFFFGPFRQWFMADELPWLAKLPTKLESR